MNKAFTANINDQVTARGYLDENDQLVMLEPEGSGGCGSGDLSIANVKVESNTLEDESEVEINLPVIIGEDDGGPACRGSFTLIVGETLKVPLYKGTAFGYPGVNITITVKSGDAVIGNFGRLEISGDCTIDVAVE